jgi:hypothetical protein
LKFVLHHRKLRHDRGVLFLGPGTDEVFIVIAKNGVKHAGHISVHPKERTSMPGADSPAKDILEQVPARAGERHP